MTLKELTIDTLMSMSQDIRMGCACGPMFSPAEMADEVRRETKHGLEHMKVIQNWEDHKHEFGL